MNARITAPSILLTRRRALAGLVGLGAAAAVFPRTSWAQSSTPDAAAPHAATPASGATAAAWTKFNLNVITSDQILTIPGAGDKMTREFAEYRPYATVLQFRQEIGKYVGGDVTTGYEQYVFVPIDPTQVDAATLATLPGVDADRAAALAKSVPFASDDAFVQAVTAVVSADQAAIIPSYLASKAQPSVIWTKFNLNTATDAQFKTIPGVDDKMLTVFSDEIGKSVDSGVVAGFERYVFVPVDATQADAETLAQLPGVNADVAAELMKSAPFASTAALLAALAKVVSTDQAAAAAAFMAS